MDIDKNKTAAFSGHRSFKMAEGEPTLFGSLNSNMDSGFGSQYRDGDSALTARITEAVGRLCVAGYDTFLCGMAEGFDLTAALAVINLRREFHGIRLLAIIPHPGQAANFSPETMETYEYVLSHADGQTTICRHYSHDCFHRRNDFLVDNSTALVCYYNGAKGGTAYTVKRALKQGSRIINVL